MSEDWLKKWYKSQFSQSSAEGLKDETWEKIDSKIGDWSGYWYKSNSEKIDAKPEPAVWENINAALDNQLKTSVLPQLLRVASIALIFVMIPYLFNDTGNGIFKWMIPDLGTSNSIQLDNQNTASSKILRAETLPFIAPNRNRKAVVSSTNSNLMASAPVEVTLSEIITTENDRETEFNYLTLLPIGQEGENHNPILDLGRTPDTRKHLWSFGMGVNIQYSNLLNAVSFKGFDSESSITNLSLLNYVYTISAARKLKSGSSISAKVLINDLKSQKYEDFAGASYIEKSLDLFYQSLQISYSYPLIKHRKFGLDLTGGVFGSYRTKIEEKWDSQDRYVLTEGFKKMNFGVTAGLNGSYKLGGSFDFIAGVYYSNGVMNVFKGTDYIPAHFLRSYTSSYGVNTGLRYNL